MHQKQIEVKNKHLMRCGFMFRDLVLDNRKSNF